MEFEPQVRWTAVGSSGGSIRLFRSHENILKPAQPAQRADICRDSSRVELLAGMKRESRFCGFRCNAMQPYEFDFVDDRIGRQGRR